MVRDNKLHIFDIDKIQDLLPVFILNNVEVVSKTVCGVFGNKTVSELKYNEVFDQQEFVCLFKYFRLISFYPEYFGDGHRCDHFR